MGKFVKIAISLPAEVLSATEARRLAQGASRSEYICEALKAHLRREQEREWDEQYIRSYTEHPESEDEELAAFAAAGVESLAAEPWE